MDSDERPKVYIETTIPSYLAAYPSRDLVVAGHQQITHEWWRTAATRFELFVSEYVLKEIKDGDARMAARRLELVQGLPTLGSKQEVVSLTEVYQRSLGLTGKAKFDVPHFAFAVAYDLDYLVTWNCTHIANGKVVRRLIEINAQIGKSSPIIVTPEALLS